MINEVRYSKFPETGEYVERVDLDTLVRIFVNHRLVFEVLFLHTPLLIQKRLHQYYFC
jgi:hypothetical protein